MHLRILRKLLLALCVAAFYNCSDDSEDITEPELQEESYKSTTEPASLGGAVNIMTYNILNDKGQTGSKLWSRRRNGIVNLLKRHNPNFVGMQEAFYHQAEYLKEQTGLDYFGFGTDDGQSQSNFPDGNQSLNPIFFR